MKKLLVVWFLCIPFFMFAQERSDTTVFIPMPVGGTSEQNQFFLENFIMETTAAGYGIADDPRRGDYTLNLNITPNLIYYDDGSSDPPGPGDKQFLLIITLVRNEDNREIVKFDFQFTELDEMYEFNLYLLYQAMANVPLTRLRGGVVEMDHWRNKWLYIRASFDYPVTFYALKSPTEVIDSQAGIRLPLDHKIMPYPAASLGLEFQFLNWMSAEAGFQLTFGDPITATFIPVIEAELKFPLKPAKYFMIEPYAIIAFPMATSQNILQFPVFGLGGGVQIGVKGGEMGAFFVDVNFVYSWSEVKMRSPYPDAFSPKEIFYNRFVVGLGIGYKIGFFNRNKDPDGVQPPPAR